MNEVWTKPAIVTGAFIFAGFGVALAVNWPGQLSYDSVLQLFQGRAALYNTWHPPVMAWLLGLGDAIVPGAGLFVVFDAALAFGALFSLVVLTPARTGWLAVTVAFATVLLPQLLLYQGLVWKDVLFADASVAGFVCLAHAASRWSEFHHRAVLLAACFLLLALAALARQNGAALLPFAGAALGWIAARQGLSLRKAAMLGGGFLAGTVLFVLGAGGILNLRSNGDSGPAEQLRVLQLYDLSGALARHPDLSLDRLAEDDQPLERLIRLRGARLYSPVRIDPLMSATDLQAALADADENAIAAQWRDLIREHPWLYLQERAAAFAWVFLTPDIVACRPIFTGIEGPEREMRALGLVPRRDAKDRALETYAKGFMGTPVLSHAAFALLAGVCLVLLLRRRRPTDIAIASMLLGALGFTLTFFVISIACDYRYLYVLDLSALTALLYLALDPKSAIRGTP